MAECRTAITYLRDAGGVKEPAKLSGCLELRYRVESLERAGEGVRKAPECARGEVFMLRIEIQVVDFTVEMVRNFKF